MTATATVPPGPFGVVEAGRPAPASGLDRLGGWLAALVPAALLVGRNVKVAGGARPVYLGTSELVILAGGVVATALLSTGRARLAIPRGALAALLAFSLTLPLSNLLNVLLGLWTDWPVGAVLEMVRWFEYLALVPLAVALVRTNRQLRTVMVVAAVCLAANVGVALYQAATFDFAEARTFALFRSAADAEGLSESNPNTAGTLFMYGALTCMAWASAVRRFRARAPLVVLAAASVVALLFTLSRSSALGFAAGALLLPFTLNLGLRGRVGAFLGVAVFFAVATVAIGFAESLAARIANTVDLSGTSSDAASILERFENWRITLAAWPRYVWAGLGYGRFGQFFPFVTADNLYLELLAVVGIPGLLLFVGMLARLGCDALTTRPRTPEQGAVRAGYLSVLVGTAVASVTGSVLLSPRVCGAFFLLTGLLYVVRRRSELGARA